MDFVTEQVRDATVVTLMVDHLDFDNASEFRRHMKEVADSAQHVVLCLDRVQFVDSSGLGAILSALRALSAKGGDLSVCGVTPSVAALLRLVRLDQILQVFASREEAVSSIGR
jgi:anti-sigma B factor antagonist